MPFRSKKRYSRPAGKGVHAAILKEGFTHRKKKLKTNGAPAAKMYMSPAAGMQSGVGRRLVRARSFSYGYGNGILVDQQLNALARFAYCNSRFGADGVRETKGSGGLAPVAASRLLQFYSMNGSDCIHLYSKKKARRLRVYIPNVSSSARLWRRKYDYSHLGSATRELYQRLVTTADLPLRLEAVHPMAMDVWYFLLHKKKFQPLFSQLEVAGPLASLKKKTLATRIRVMAQDPVRAPASDSNSPTDTVHTSIDQVWWCPSTGILWLIEIKKDQHISREHIYARNSSKNNITNAPKSHSRPRSKSVFAAPATSSRLGEFLQSLAKNHSGSAAAQVAINHMLFLHSHNLVLTSKPQEQKKTSLASVPLATELSNKQSCVVPSYVSVRSALCVVNTAGLHFIEII